MKTLIFTALFFLCLGSACATDESRSASRCAVTQIDELLADPVRYAGQRFCGEVFAVQPERVTYLLRSAEDMPPEDVALLVTTRSRPLLTGLSETPARYYVEARVDPQSECFVPSGSGEECVPWRRPVFMHVIRARERP